MAACLRCTADNPDQFAFCGACGTPLVVATCPACATVARPDQAFCGSCGTPMGAPAAAEAHPVEERKLATVLFADVVGFTSMAERMDPEVVARIVNAAFRDMAAVVADHGGTVDKYMGDCLMAVFGVPLAHDDDAARAVAAGLALSRLGGDLAFSIGINSGEVMATAVGGSGDMTVIGDTVNVAARLEKAAGPGQVLCGPVTAELAGGHAVLVPYQSLVLKGKAEPVPAWEATCLVLAPGGAPTDAAACFVGRDDELSWLLRLWQRAKEGTPQIALVCGDAGVGKTRLLEELSRSIADDALVVRASHPPFGATGGQRLAVDVLGQIGADDLSERVTTMGTSSAGLPEDSDPASIPEERLRSFVHLLDQRTATTPVALLIDDLHHADGTVLEFLAALPGRMSRLPVLLVLAGRNEPPGWLAPFPTATTVRLGALEGPDVIELANSLVSGPSLDDRSLVLLAERSGGNPLHLRELARLAVGGGARVVAGRTRLELGAAVPTSLRALLGARLDALGADRKLIVQRVALLGPGASTSLVEALGPLAERDALRDLVAHGILRRLHGGGLELVDPLLGEVAYEALPQNLRADLHRRAAALMDGGAARARPLDRAAHYLPDDEELAAEAAFALSVLGQELARAWRLPEARRTLERAVAHGARDPEMLLALGRLHEAAGDTSAVTAALSLLGTWPASLVVERDHIEARAVVFSDPARGRELLHEVASRWDERGEPAKAAWAWANAGVASFDLGEMSVAASELERALAVFNELGDRSGVVGAESFLALIRPDDPRAEGWLADTLEFADSTGDRAKQLAALLNLTWLQFVGCLLGTASDAAPAEDLARRLVQVAAELGVEGAEVQGRCLLAITARLTGRLPAAAAQLADIDSASEPILLAAARFAVASASDALAVPGVEPPVSVDPVVVMSSVVVGTALVLAGRAEEALSWLSPDSSGDGTGPGLVVRAVRGLALSLVGRSAESAQLVSHMHMRTFGGRPLARAVAGLASEVPDLPGSGVEPSIASAVILRAAALRGDAAALGQLHAVADELAAPGLLVGL